MTTANPFELAEYWNGHIHDWDVMVDKKVLTFVDGFEPDKTFYPHLFNKSGEIELPIHNAEYEYHCGDRTNKTNLFDLLFEMVCRDYTTNRLKMATLLCSSIVLECSVVRFNFVGVINIQLFKDVLGLKNGDGVFNSDSKILINNTIETNSSFISFVNPKRYVANDIFYPTVKNYKEIAKKVMAAISPIEAESESITLNSHLIYFDNKFVRFYFDPLDLDLKDRNFENMGGCLMLRIPKPEYDDYMGTLVPTKQTPPKYVSGLLYDYFLEEPTDDVIIDKVCAKAVGILSKGLKVYIVIEHVACLTRFDFVTKLGDSDRSNFKGLQQLYKVDVDFTFTRGGSYSMDCVFKIGNIVLNFENTVKKMITSCLQPHSKPYYLQNTYVPK